MGYLSSISGRGDPGYRQISSELIFAAEAPAATLNARLRRGELRRLFRGIYTTNPSNPRAEIVRRNRWAITAILFPGAVVTDRSALPGLQDPGIVFLVRPGRARDVDLPGLLIRSRSGTGPIPGDQALGQYPLHQASLARALVDNTQPSRSRGGRPRRTVDQEGLEETLVGIARREGDEHLGRLREEVERVGAALDRGGGEDRHANHRRAARRGSRLRRRLRAAARPPRGLAIRPRGGRPLRSTAR
jgi:hypothetical protein